MCREYCLYGRLCRVGKISYVFGRSSIRRSRRDIEYDSGNSSGDDRISLRKGYRREKEIRSQIVKLAVWGTSMFVVGYLWSYAAPLNKRLWSPSFVLVTCGITSLIFATLIYIIDDSKRTRWSFPFLVVGVNPLSIYIFSEIAGGLFRKLQWTTISFEGIWQPLFGNYGGSLAYALAFLMFNWLIAFFLYKKHIYIKL